MRAKRAGKFLKLNCRERSERKMFGKFCTFTPNSSKLRSGYLLSPRNRVGGDIVTRPFVGGWVSEWVRA